MKSVDDKGYKFTYIKLSMVKNPNCEFVNTEDSFIKSITNKIPVVLKGDADDGRDARVIGVTTGEAFIQDGTIYGEVMLWDKFSPDMDTLEWCNSMCEVVPVPDAGNTFTLTSWDWFMYKRKDGSLNETKDC